MAGMNAGYDGGKCGEARTSTWDEVLIKQAGELLDNAREVRNITQEKVQRILGCCDFDEPKVNAMPCAPKREPDCFNAKMIELLYDIAIIGREIKHEIERL
jgi:hypothetical protein